MTSFTVSAWRPTKVSIPQAVGTIAIYYVDYIYNYSMRVSIPQAVGTIAIHEKTIHSNDGNGRFQYRKR